MALNNAPDLTQHPPRSPRIRLGGYALLPRCLDKGRATINGKNGEYHYNCPLDQRFFEFVGLDAEALKTQLQAGKGDGEILDWINQNAKLSLGHFDLGQQIDYKFPQENKCLFIFTITGSISVDGQEVKRRDAIGFWQTGQVSITTREETEFLIIETVVNQK